MAVRFTQLALGAAQEGGSTVFHHSPEAVRRRIAEQLLHLAGPRDVALRWRVGSSSPALRTNGAWGHNYETPRPPQRDTSQWPGRVWSVDRQAMETARSVGGRPAVAYAIGELVMVGTAQDHTNFLNPVDDQGNPDEQGNRLGVVMRTGAEGLWAGIGVVTTGNRRISLLDPLVSDQSLGLEVPRGLLRV